MRIHIGTNVVGVLIPPIYVTVYSAIIFVLRRSHAM